MTKGLEALKELKQDLTPRHFSNIQKLDRYNIIEKELKENEELKTSLIIITCENAELLKYKKALEIIKKYYVFEVNQFYPFKRKNITNENKDEIELLKEVLL